MPISRSPPARRSRLLTAVMRLSTVRPLLDATANVASSARMSVGDRAWVWVERASAIITIAGLVVLYLQLRQLIATPKLRLGFPRDPGGTGRRLMQVTRKMEIPVHWNSGSALSEPFKIAVVVVNEISASASAQGIAFEVRYPLYLVSQGDDQLTQPPGITDAQCLIKKDIDLNPGATYFMRSTFRLPRNRKRIQVLASLRERKAIDKMLEISVKEI